MEISNLCPHSTIFDCGAIINRDRLGNFHCQRYVSTSTAAPNCKTLVHQCGQRDLPALSYLTETVTVGDTDIGEVNLVEVGIASELLDWLGFDTHSLHVH